MSYIIKNTTNNKYIKNIRVRSQLNKHNKIETKTTVKETKKLKNALISEHYTIYYDTNFDTTLKNYKKIPLHIEQRKQKLKKLKTKWYHK